MLTLPWPCGCSGVSSYCTNSGMFERGLKLRVPRHWISQSKLRHFCSWQKKRVVERGCKRFSQFSVFMVVIFYGNSEQNCSQVWTWKSCGIGRPHSQLKIRRNIRSNPEENLQTRTTSNELGKDCWEASAITTSPTTFPAGRRPSEVKRPVCTILCLITTVF